MGTPLWPQHSAFQVVAVPAAGLRPKIYRHAHSPHPFSRAWVRILTFPSNPIPQARTRKTPSPLEKKKELRRLYLRPQAFDAWPPGEQRGGGWGRVTLRPRVGHPVINYPDNGLQTTGIVGSSIPRQIRCKPGQVTMSFRSWRENCGPHPQIPVPFCSKLKHFIYSVPMWKITYELTF